MSLSDFYHKNKISIVDELPPSRWGQFHMPNKTVPTWKGYLRFMRAMWDLGETTELETAFFEYFSGKKPRRWLNWLTKP